jgi:TPP-dependent 2-oxoacid decarboxylase
MQDFVFTTNVRGYLTRNWRENHLNYNDVKKWEYRDFLGNLGIFWELTWDFYKITVGNAVEEMNSCNILSTLPLHRQ